MANSEAHRRQYEEWVRLYAPELFRFAYRLAGNRQVAEDLMQETFVEAWRSVGKQRHPERARAWLFQILRFRYAHHLRDNRHHRQTAPLQDLDRPTEQTAPLDAMALQETVQRAVDGLAPDVRETFLMVFLQGAKCREAAEALHIPLGTVLSRISRARAILRQTLHDKIGDRSVAEPQIATILKRELL